MTQQRLELMSFEPPRTRRVGRSSRDRCAASIFVAGGPRGLGVVYRVMSRAAGGTAKAQHGDAALSRFSPPNGRLFAGSEASVSRTDVQDPRIHCPEPRIWPPERRSHSP